MSDSRTIEESQVQTIAHGVLCLEVLQRSYGITRRRMEVLKIRASTLERATTIT